MKKARSLGNSRFLTLRSTGDERIELPPKVLETPIIPLDQSPIDCFRVRDTRYLYHETIFIVKQISKKDKKFLRSFTNEGIFHYEIYGNGIFMPLSPLLPLHRLLHCYVIL